jgi:hypothetical protein
MTKDPNKIIAHLNFETVAVAHISNQWATSIAIIEPSNCDENGFSPAQSVCVQKIEGITNLRDLCNEVIVEYEKRNPKPEEKKV